MTTGVFVTTDLKTAGLALAVEGAQLDRLDDANPREIAFVIRGVPANFDRLMFVGQIRVDAGRAWQGLEQVHKLLMASKRRTVR